MFRCCLGGLALYGLIDTRYTTQTDLNLAAVLPSQSPKHGVMPPCPICLFKKILLKDGSMNSWTQHRVNIQRIFRMHSFE